MSNNQLPFIPIRGTEKSILSRTNYADGSIYFATDTGKIFLDTATERINMGGTGASVFFSEDKDITQQVGGIYIIDQDSLVNATGFPKINDLIINTVDGRFFKIRSIDEDNFLLYCSLIAVSGTGGGGGSIENASISLDLKIGYSFIYGQSYYIPFIAYAKIDKKVNISYEIIGSNNQYYTNTITGIETGIVYNNFDLGIHLFPGPNDINIKVYSDNDGENQYFYTGRQSYIMELIPSKNFNSLIPKIADNFTFYYTVTGSVDKTISIYLDDVLIKTENIGKSTGDRDIVINAPNDIIPHKACKLTAVLTHTDSGAKATPLTYEIAWIDPSNQITPVIWINNYPKEINNYDNLNVEYMVYDPRKIGVNGKPEETTVLLEVNNNEVPPQTINYVEQIENKQEFVTWSIINYVEGLNSLKISCGSAHRELFVQVNKDTRDLSLSQKNSIILNLSSRGRSNNETFNSKNSWISNPNSEKYYAIFNNFNWYNNGWFLDKNSNSCLRISNGASLGVRFPGQFVYNKIGEEMANATFEIRFKVSNVKNYSNLINNITEYQLTNGNWISEKELENIDEDDLMKNELGFNIVRVIKNINFDEGVFCSFLDNNIGFALGAQEAYFTTGSQTVNVRYKEDEIITISFAISNIDQLLYIYLNGILSGVVTINKEFQITQELISFNSNYCDIDLYDIRIYNTSLTIQNIIQNYLSDQRSISLYDQNMEILGNINRTRADGSVIVEPTIDYNNLLIYNNTRTNIEDLSMCYMTIRITDNDGKSVDENGNIRDLDDDRLPYYKGNKRKAYIKFINPSLDKAYELGNISDDYYIHHCPSFEAQGIELNVQGTSSQGYPRRNYKAKLKKGGSYLSGPYAGKTFDKFYMDNNSCATNVFTWKIDYMESSSSHNTGLANLMDTMYSQHPMDFYDFDTDTDDYRTTVYGFPCLVFHEKSTGEFEFIGKYNFNLDKSSNEYYGYENEGEQKYITYEDGTHPKICDIAESWEFRNNQGIWTSFKLPEGVTSFSAPIDNSTGLQEFIQHFEYRYITDTDEMDEIYDGKIGDNYTFHSVAEANNFLKEKYENLEKLFMWVNSTDTEKATNNPITPTMYTVSENYMKLILQDGENINKDEYNEDVTYYIYNLNDKIISEYEWTRSEEERLDEFEAMKNQFYIEYNELNSKNPVVSLDIKKTFTIDSEEYRITKFKEEFTDHFNLEYCLIYFIMTELLIMFDSRGKNMFLSTWGPKEENGEYIWFPVFYDMDTQLGVNNTGIPSYEYDVDPTPYSTGNSVLWINFAKCFSKEIKEKYQSLRGNDDGLLTQTKLENSYNLSPKTYTDSYAMKGVRPIVIHNIDEYYKYLAIMYSGYINTAGEKKYDSGSFLYACQGTRELYRNSLLRNRLNYIDSRWSASNYSTSSTSSASLWMRVNYNNYLQTSDKFIDRDLTNEEIEQGILQKKEFPQLLDSRPNFKLTPYLNQYITVGYDQIYVPNVKASTNISIEVPAPDTIINSAKTQTGIPDQLIYIPGAEYLEDVGDLSLKYLSEFHFDTAIRTKKLKLGNDNNNYQNQLLTGDRLVLADEANSENKKPLLESIILTNLINLDNAIDVSGSPKLLEFRALNTSIPEITFSEGVALKTLHLPSSITKLELINAWNLKSLIEDSTNIFDNSNNIAKEGLYIQNFTDKDISDIDKIKLSHIKIEGGNLGIASYILLNKAIQVKLKEQEATGEGNLKIYFKDVNWSPYTTIEKDTQYNISTNYYTITNHYEIQQFLGSEEEWKKEVLKNNIYVKNNNFNTSIITDISLLETCLDNNNFTSTEVISGGVLKPFISGNICINNTSETPVDDYRLKELMNNYSNLNLYAKYVNKGKAITYIQKINDIEEILFNDLYNLNIEDENYILINKPNIIPIQQHYDFKYWTKSLINPSDYFNGENSIEIDKKDTEDIILYAYFEPHKYQMNFYYQDGTLIEGPVEYEYNQLIKTPNLIPAIEDDLGDFERYGFKGYTSSSSSSEIINFEKEYCIGIDKNYYAYFVEENVYENPSDLNIFSFTSIKINDIEGWSVQINDKYIENKIGTISGKITIPSYYNNKPVIEIAGANYSYSTLIEGNGFIFNKNLTHIFWYETSEHPLSLMQIGQHAFFESGLKYFQFISKQEANLNKSTLININANAFQNTNLKNTQINAQNYGTACFNGSLENSDTIYLNGNFKKMDNYAFSNNSFEILQFGTEKDPCVNNPIFSSNALPSTKTCKVYCTPTYYQIWIDQFGEDNVIKIE